MEEQMEVIDAYKTVCDMPNHGLMCQVMLDKLPDEIASPAEVHPVSLVWCAEVGAQMGFSLPAIDAENVVIKVEEDEQFCSPTTLTVVGTNTAKSLSAAGNSSPVGRMSLTGPRVDTSPVVGATSADRTAGNMKSEMVLFAKPHPSNTTRVQPFTVGKQNTTISPATQPHLVNTSGIQPLTVGKTNALLTALLTEPHPANTSGIQLLTTISPSCYITSSTVTPLISNVCSISTAPMQQPTAICPINVTNTQVNVSAVILQSALPKNSGTDATSLTNIATRMISNQQYVAQLITDSQSAPCINTVILNQHQADTPSRDQSYYVCEDAVELKRLLLDSNIKRRDAECRLRLEQLKNEKWQLKVAELQGTVKNLEKQLDESRNNH